MSIERWSCAVVVLLSSLVLGQSLPGVMPFPLEIKRAPQGFTKEDRESTQREYTRLLRLAGAKLPDFTRYDRALSELKRQDCEREDECLVQLAKKAESLYGLYVSLDSTIEGALSVSGRVVRDDGKLASPTRTVTLKEEGQPVKDTAAKALSQLFAELKIAELSAARPVETKEPLKEVEARLPAVSRAEDPGASQHTVGAVVFIAGAVVLASGAAVLVSGQVIGGGLKPDGELNLPIQQLPAYQNARTLTTGGLIGLAAGGATALVGAFIWGLAPSAPIKVSAIAGPEGASLFVRGEF